MNIGRGKASSGKVNIILAITEQFLICKTRLISDCHAFSVILRDLYFVIGVRVIPCARTVKEFARL